MTVRLAYVALIVLIAAAGTVGFAPSDAGVVASPGAPPSVSPAGQSVIARVHPAAGSRVCRLPRIGVELRLADAMRKAGSFDLSTVSLTLDGQEVTRQAVVVGTLTSPQSHASLMYMPSAPLALGTHHAAFTYPSAAGRTTHRWAFTVADIPCP